MSFSKDIGRVVNYFFPVSGNETTNTGEVRKQSALHPAGYIAPVQLARIRTDIEAWRNALREAEQVWWPHRVKMQQILQDTILNGQVSAAMDKRKNLSLLKDFEIQSGEKSDAGSTKLLQKEWFYNLLNYCLDARFFGYTLIALGDIVDYEFPHLELIKRQNVSPDRHVLSTFMYSNTGIDFLNPEIKDDAGNSFYDWTVYVDTPTENAGSKCGYGILYKLAYYEILIRSNIGYNATALELFGQPLRVGKTSKKDEYERATFAAGLRDMGSNGYMLMDPVDEIEFIESRQGGKGQNGFEDFETRMLKMINKVVLGHADAIDSQTGKLGAQDDVKEAISQIEKVDNKWLENVVNTKILPKLQNLGLPIPLGYKFKIINNREKQETRKQEDESNKITADIAQTMKNAGLQMDEVYFTERTGIPAKKIEEPVPAPGALNPAVQKKIKALYNDRVK